MNNKKQSYHKKLTNKGNLEVTNSFLDMDIMKQKNRCKYKININHCLIEVNKLLQKYLELYNFRCSFQFVFQAKDLYLASDLA